MTRNKNRRWGSLSNGGIVVKRRSRTTPTFNNAVIITRRAERVKDKPGIRRQEIKKPPLAVETKGGSGCRCVV